MKKVFVSVFCLLSCYSTAQYKKIANLQNGDLLFQNLDCGALCDAIEAVTNGYRNHSFSHIGMVYVQHDTVFVIEAIGKDVHLTPISAFRSRNANNIFVGRVRRQYKYLIPQALGFAVAQNGVLYDDVFLYGNGKYYCSELLYDAFKSANNNQAFFTLEPMTFCKPNTKTFFEAWIDYYSTLGVPIPEQENGINPGGISRSEKIKMLGILK